MFADTRVLTVRLDSFTSFFGFAASVNVKLITSIHVPGWVTASLNHVALNSVRSGSPSCEITVFITQNLQDKETLNKGSREIFNNTESLQPRQLLCEDVTWHSSDLS